MHSRKRGKSASRKPLAPSLSWLQSSKEEVFSIIEKLVKEGRKEAEIGLILRDQYGVPDVKTVFGKKLSRILDGKKLSPKYPSDLIDLIKKAVNLRKHLAANPRDKLNKAKLVCIESKIRRLVKHYRKTKKLPHDWKYEPEKATLLVK